MLFRTEMQPVSLKPADFLQVTLVAEIIVDALCADVPNVRDAFQFFFACGCQGIDAAEMACKRLGRSLPDKTDSKRK